MADDTTKRGSPDHRRVCGVREAFFVKEARAADPVPDDRLVPI